ncbi:hypothetical protein G9A89_020053 [Geosiphon pyriformis]|nr:hypothetical protein G9A89_020053 [Geosiphon pyriformis]
MEDVVSYQFAQVRQRRDDRHEIEYELILRQQPKQSRMCGIGEKADRRPIDPPPIIQLKVYDGSISQTEKSNSFLQNPYFFMYASLVAPDSDEELHLLRDGKTRSTTGSVVSSLYHLKDIDNSDAGFFVFPDLSVRMEGTYRLKLSLFEIIGYGTPRREVYHCKSIFSEIFIVYSAKRFPGMEESTFLSRSFADQGLKIRIRKEIRLRRRTNKRKELEAPDSSENSLSKRSRGDGENDPDGSNSQSDEDMREASPEDSQLKVSSETANSASFEKKSSSSSSSSKEQSSHSSSSPRPRGPYDHHIPPHHYDGPIYGPGYGRPPHPWHDRDYGGEHSNYPPYYDPYDRRYLYHSYPYYPHLPPPPEGTDHRYSYAPPLPYGRPPMYHGYYDPVRMQHSSASESPGSNKPYPYDPYPGYPRPGAPWSHYAERPLSSKDNSSSSHHRSGAPMTTPPPRGLPGMYPYHPEYYGPYPPPLHIPHSKGDYGESQAQNNENEKASPRPYGPPSSGYPPHHHYSPLTRDYPLPYLPRNPHDAPYPLPHDGQSGIPLTNNSNSSSAKPSSSYSPEASTQSQSEEKTTKPAPISLSESSKQPQKKNDSSRKAEDAKRVSREHSDSNEITVRPIVESENFSGNLDVIAPEISEEAIPLEPMEVTFSSLVVSNSGSPSSNRVPLTVDTNLMSGPGNRNNIGFTSHNGNNTNGSTGNGTRTLTSSPLTPSLESPISSKRQGLSSTPDIDTERDVSGVNGVNGNNNALNDVGSDRNLSSGNIKPDTERYS